jgi:hypothetical protein
VQARDPDVDHPVNLGAQERRGHRRLLGDREIARAGARDGDRARRVRRRCRRHDDGPRELVIARALDRPAHMGGLIGAAPGGQRARPTRGQAGHDRRDLLGGLPLAQHDLRHPGARRAGAIDHGVRDVAAQADRELVGGLFGPDPPGGDVVEELAQGGRVHGTS